MCAPTALWPTQPLGPTNIRGALIKQNSPAREILYLRSCSRFLNWSYSFYWRELSHICSKFRYNIWFDIKITTSWTPTTSSSTSFWYQFLQFLYSPIPTPIIASDSPLRSSITPSLFHSHLKTYLFHKSYPRSFSSSSRTAFTDRFFWATQYSAFVFSFSLFFVSVPCARLSWPSRQLLSARKSIISYRMVLLKYRSFSRGLFFIGALRSMFIGCRLINGERVIVCLIDEHLTRTGTTINRDRTQWPTQDLEISKVDWRILGGQTPIRLRVW